MNVATINFPLALENVLNTSLIGEDTLLDADLVIADTSRFSSLWNNLTDPIFSSNRINPPNSRYLKSHFQTKRNEIDVLLNNGKVVIAFLSSYKTCKLGVKQHVYETYNNYSIFPYEFEFSTQLKTGKSSSKNSIKLIDKNSYFKQYFDAFKDNLFYTTYLDIDKLDTSKHFLVNRSNKPVSFVTNYKNGIIAFLILPINFDQQKLINVLISCANKFFKKGISSTPPDWIKEFKLKKENFYDNKIKEIEVRINNLNQDLIIENFKKEKVTNLKKLLYASGTELENIVIDAFTLMGFNTKNRKLGNFEHDIIFNADEGQGIAEIEGKDKDAIKIDKLDQLTRAVDEDFSINENYREGILIGNPYRLQNPNERQEPFTNKVLTAAKRKGFGLLTTVEIYNVVKYILDNPKDEAFKKKCREKILNTKGEIIKLI